NNEDLTDQADQIAGYFADLIKMDTFKVARRDDPLDTGHSQPNRDRYLRWPVNAPTIDPYLQSQSTDPALRFRSVYFASDQRPSGELLPPDTRVPGSVGTHWHDQAFPDPRVPTTPFLASSTPTWLRLRDNSGLLPKHRDNLHPWLDDRDWEMISNPS